MTADNSGTESEKTGFAQIEVDKEALILFFERLLDVLTGLKIEGYFVGGCVRDHLLGQATYDYDLSVNGEIGQIATALQENYKLKASILGTAKICFGNYQVDLATFRSERYVTNNGLPEVDSGDIETDLKRRDFTINTGYVLLNRENLDKMLRVGAVYDSELDTDADTITEIDIKTDMDIDIAYAHPKFHDDINNRCLQVLHEKSFVEDPSRLMRAVKYITLYHLKMNDQTRSLFQDAVNRKCIEMYSKDRYRQIVLAYADHDQGLKILAALFENRLLIRLNHSDTARVDAYLDRYFKAPQSNQGIQLLILMYEYQLDFWLGADRRISDVAKAFIELMDMVSKTEVAQWQSRWNAYERFNAFNTDVLKLAQIAESIPVAVKMALHIYCEETRFIKLSVTGNALKNRGMESGRKMGTLMNLLLAYKVETGADMSLEEEIRWIESRQYEY